MNLHQLRVFYTVAQWMSFSAAARELYLTQPAVSLQVRALERRLGVKLFDRSARRLKLTEAGEALLPSAAAMLHAEDEARRAIDELRGASRGQLIVGTNTTGGMYLVPRILRAFRAAQPSIQLILDIDATDYVCERVHQNMIDLGVVGGPIQDERLTVEPVVEDQVVLIASPDHPLAAQGAISLEELATESLIVPEPRSRTRLLVERHLREAGLNIRPAMQLVGTEAVKKAVEANLGLAFVSAFAIERELALGALCRLDVAGLDIVRQLELIYRSGKYFTPAASHFREFMQRYVAERLCQGTTTPRALLA